MLTVSQTAELLQTVDHVLILTHVRPDGDTVGCAAALCAGLRALGKTAYLLPNPELTRTHRPLFPALRGPGGLRPGDRDLHRHRHRRPVPGKRQALRRTGGSGH